MADWNAELYLKFERQRTQPARDLARHIAHARPETALDLGCGPGNSTAVLREVFPQTQLKGVDNSSAMIEKARKKYPELAFEQDDVRAIAGTYDLLFSNACLQWVPDHQTLLPYLMSRLSDGGMLAVQVPINDGEPLYQIIREVVAQSPYDFSRAQAEYNRALAPAAYYDILAGCTADFDLWETVYYHDMPSHEALLDWVRGTRLRPYLECLDAAQQAAFEAELLRQTRERYPLQQNGRVILRFRRLFFVARK